jgi:hypothetical protein
MRCLKKKILIFSCKNELELERTVKRIRIFVEYLAAFLIIFMLLSVITSVVIAKFYGDDLQENAMELVNEQLDTKVAIDEIGISILRNFPNTSLFLKNVTVWSGQTFNRHEFQDFSADTLFKAERLYLKFNLPDLLRKKFSIKSMEAKEGFLRILIDSSGTGNFVIEREKEHENSRLLNIKGVSLRNIDFQYINRAKKIDAGGRIQELFMEGDFFKQKSTLKAGGDLYIDRIINHGVIYLHHQQIKSDIALTVDKNHVSISKGGLIVGDLSAEISGAFLIDKEKGADLDLQFSGKKIDIEWVSGILAGFIKYPEGITGKGKIDLSISLTGLLSPTITPHINASFSTRNASLDIEKTALKLRAVSLEGSYTNGLSTSVRSSVFQLHNIHATSGSSRISGSLRIENFLSPNFEAGLIGDLKAIELQRFINNYPLVIGEGSLKVNLTAAGTVSGLKEGKRTATLVPAGKVEFTDLHLTVEPSNINFNRLNGRLDIQPDKWMADLTGYVNQTDFRVDISTNNPFKSIAGKTFVKVEGKVHSSNLDIDRLLQDVRKEEEGEKRPTYPKKISANLDFDFDRITKGGIQTKQVSGTLIYKYPGLYLDPVYLETMNGFVNSRLALIDLHKPIHQLSMSSSFRDVEIQDIFKSFNNFGQGFLTHENIAGSISGDSEFTSAFNNDFTLNMADIVSENNLSIENGELINFKPMIELSRFLKIDQMDHIYFSNISNTILINENTITIPQMDIKSSALNLQASGIHSFDKRYEYHLAAKLSDLLFNKAKSVPNPEFNIALDKNDKRTIFLVLFDEGSGMTVEFDDEQAMKKIRQDLKNEKTVLKSILKKEFGLFEKDETVSHGTESTEKPVMKFDFSIEEPADSIKEKTEEKSRWWNRKNQEDKKPAFEFVIDDNDL